MPNKVTFEDFVSPPEKNEMQNYSFFISLFFLFSFFFFFWSFVSIYDIWKFYGNWPCFKRQTHFFSHLLKKNKFVSSDGHSVEI